MTRPNDTTTSVAESAEYENFVDGTEDFSSVTVAAVVAKQNSKPKAPDGWKMWQPDPNYDPSVDGIPNKNLRWVELDSDGKRRYTTPKFPVYIISKGRSETMLTSKSLAKIRVPHYIAIEPQDKADYENALDKFNIRDFVDLLILPFSNHGDGPGRARNWCWDHAIELGAKRHWVLDDNITDFFMPGDGNIRTRVNSGAIFRAAEKFADNFSNVPISGFQYRHFYIEKEIPTLFDTNTRIYSTLLIENNCPYRWRGRYNEDTDLCLRVLKDYERNYCTIHFTQFLQGKAGTQAIKGGNTDEYYHVQGNTDEASYDGGVNPAGTINKSMMLKDMHPDVTSIIWYGKRYHHLVNYDVFANKRLELRPGVKRSGDPLGYALEYGLEFVTDWDED